MTQPQASAEAAARDSGPAECAVTREPAAESVQDGHSWHDEEGAAQEGFSSAQTEVRQHAAGETVHHQMRRLDEEVAAGHDIALRDAERTRVILEADTVRARQEDDTRAATEISPEATQRAEGGADRRAVHQVYAGPDTKGSQARDFFAKVVDFFISTMGVSSAEDPQEQRDRECGRNVRRVERAIERGLADLAEDEALPDGTRRQFQRLAKELGCLKDEVEGDQHPAGLPGRAAAPDLLARIGKAEKRISEGLQRTVRKECRTEAGADTVPDRASTADESWEPIMLTVGSPHDSGVVVQHVDLGTQEREIEIRRSYGVMIGADTEQFNQFHYRLDPPQVRLDRIADGQAWEALAKLVHDPDDAAANAEFRALLSGGPAYSSRGEVQFVDTTAAEVTRVKARRDESGRVVIVDRSQGMSVGDGNVQYNRFCYRVRKPEIHLEARLRDSPELASSLARALQDPEDQSGFAEFSRLLSQQDEVADWALHHLNRPAGDGRTTVDGGKGVQVGIGAAVRRKDKVDFTEVSLELTRLGALQEKVERSAATRSSATPRHSKRTPLQRSRR